jgi:hypothetical protein
LPQGWYSLGTALSVRNLLQFSYKFRLLRISAIFACVETATSICVKDSASNSDRGFRSNSMIHQFGNAC